MAEGINASSPKGFWAAPSANGFAVYTMRGEQISGDFNNIEGAIDGVCLLTDTIAQHKRCEICSGGFVTGDADQELCPSCRKAEIVR